MHKYRLQILSWFNYYFLKKGSVSYPPYTFRLNVAKYDKYVLTEIWEKDTYFIAQLPEHLDAAVVDIGGHIGGFAIKAAQKWPDQKIYSIEPHPGNLFFLKRNILLNKLSERINTLNAALSDLNGTITLHIHPLNTAGHTIEKNSRYKCLTVKTYSLSTFLKKMELERIGLLKLDCEGAEYPILLSSPLEVLKKIDNIVCELHYSNFYSKEKLCNHLFRAGFSIQHTQSDTINRQCTIWYSRTHQSHSSE